MAWRLFSELTPAQAVVAQQQVQQRQDNYPFIKLERREYLVVDGVVKGSRLRGVQGRLIEILSDVTPPSKGSLQGWTGGPEKWWLDQC